MLNADRPDGPLGQSQASKNSTDLLVVGGGVMGLWAALKASRLGLKTTLVEARTIGSGASGGLLGALMPYMPDNWDDKKAFQFRSLLALEEEIAALEDQTGLSAGYRRSGRLIPLPKPHLRVIAERHEKDALRNWKDGKRQFYWGVTDHDPNIHAISSEFCASGVVVDTLAARVSPRAYIAVLKRALEHCNHVRLIEHVAVNAIDQTHSRAALSNGEVISFGHVIIASGHEAFPLLGQALSQPADLKLGAPIKGQSALLRAKIDPTAPVIFLNGIYIIPHEDGTVAVGSTSENRFDEPFSIDGQLETLLEQAAHIRPELRQAEVIERWAGLRPRAIGREPMVGSVPSMENIVALAGGFKITFGLAHHLAGAALAFLTGQKPDMPERFTLAHHLMIAKT